MFDWKKHKELMINGSGHYSTISLFKETTRGKLSDSPFTLDEWHTTYLDISDPTEYKTAMVLIGNWDHWMALRRSPEIRIHLDKWLEEVKVKLKSDAVDSMKKHAKAPNGSAAARWLAENGYEEKEDKRKKNSKGSTNETNDSVEKRAANLGLSIIGGSK